MPNFDVYQYDVSQYTFPTPASTSNSPRRSLSPLSRTRPSSTRLSGTRALSRPDFVPTNIPGCMMAESWPGPATSSRSRLCALRLTWTGRETAPRVERIIRSTSL
jgi:hypothetical protein